MPRVNGVMQPIPGAYGVPGNTIESAKYNSQLDDIVADLNNPRPVTAGGTGATSIETAADNIGAVSKAAGIVTANTLKLRTDVADRGVSFQTAAGTELGALYRLANGSLVFSSDGVVNFTLSASGIIYNAQTVWHSGNINPWSADKMANLHSLGFMGVGNTVPYMVRLGDQVTCRLYSEFNYPGWPTEIPEKFNALRLTAGGTVTGVPVPAGAVVTFVGKTGGGDAYDMGYRFLQGFSPSRGWISAVNS